MLLLLVVLGRGGDGRVPHLLGQLVEGSLSWEIGGRHGEDGTTTWSGRGERGELCRVCKGRWAARFFCSARINSGSGKQGRESTWGERWRDSAFTQ